MCFAKELSKFVGREDFSYEQDRVRAGQPSFEYLIARQDEVFAQKRHANCSPNEHQISQVALEERLVGQHTDTSSAVCFVDSRDGNRIEIVANHAGRGGCLFYLGNDAYFAWNQKSAHKIERGRRARELAFQLCLWSARQQGGDLRFFAGNDALEDIVHEYRTRDSDEIGAAIMLNQFWVFAYASGAVFAVTAFLIALGCAIWGRPIPLWPPHRNRFVPWGGIEVLVAFSAIVLLIPLTLELFLHASGLFRWLYDLSGGDFNAQFAGDDKKLFRHLGPFEMGLGFPLKILLLAALLHASCDFRPYQLGLTKYRLWPMLVLGCLVWFFCALPCDVIHVFISHSYNSIFPQPPEIHDVMLIAQEHPSPGEWVLLIGSATLVAPCLEEFMFRGLLLRWLSVRPKGAAITFGITLVLAFLVRTNKFDAAWQQHDPNGLADALAPVVFVLVVGSTMMALNGLMSDRRNLIKWQAILASSLVFAIAHANVWPSPIALFIFAVCLAWVACRTQSIVPGIVAHGLFNSVACVQLVIGLGLNQPTP
jgi:membrane protease YdiL (CAAX protease family)